MADVVIAGIVGWAMNPASTSSSSSPTRRMRARPRDGGRAVAEVILDGDYASVDLHLMGYQRVVDDRPYSEHGIR